jgi:hypothetical protein
MTFKPPSPKDYKDLFFHSVSRIDLTNGNKATFSLVSDGQFIDNEMSRNRDSISGLVPGRTYIYQGMPTANITTGTTAGGSGVTATTASFAPGPATYSVATNGAGSGGGVFSGVSTTGAGNTAGSPIFTGTFNPYWGAGNNQIQPPTKDTATAATDNISLMSLSAYAPGWGGSSGSGSISTAAGNGGKGWRGGGGGSGGGSATGFNAGSGASGGDGYVVIVAYR